MTGNRRHAGPCSIAAAGFIAAALGAANLAGAQIVPSDNGLVESQQQTLVLNRLWQQYGNDTQLREARTETADATLRLRLLRDTLLMEVRRSSEYRLIAERVRRAEEEVRQLHWAYPPQPDAVSAAAMRVLELRRALTEFESRRVEEDEDYVVAFYEMVDARSKMVREQQRVEAMIRNDPAYVEAARRLRESRG